MKPDASQDQLDTVKRDLEDNPQVKSVRFVDKHEAYTEFLKLFPDSPELTGSLQVGRHAAELPRRAPHRRQQRGRPHSAGSSRASRACSRWSTRRRRSTGSGRSRASSACGLIVAAIVLLGRRGAAHLEHDPHRHLRPPPRGRGDEAGRRHQLVHPRPVHARRARAGRGRRHRRLLRRVGAERLLEEPGDRQPRAGAAQGVWWCRPASIRFVFIVVLRASVPWLAPSARPSPSRATCRCSGRGGTQLR